MKPLMLLLALMTPFVGMAQTDTTATDDGEQMQSLSLGVTSDQGFQVQMTDGDTITDKGAWTIDTKYKRITITSVPKPWASVDDSIEVVLKDIRTKRRNQFT